MRGFLVLFALAACGDDTRLATPADANPLGSTANILPFPSSLYEVADATSPTGVHLDIPSGVIPVDAAGDAFDPTPLNPRSGWPSTVTILWAAPSGVDPTTLVPYTNYGASLQPDSSTMIVDMTTGALVAHFAEVDANEQADFDHQAVYLRPAQRLASGHRYAVGIRNTVTTRDGKPVAITPGFADVLANRNSGHARLDAARPRLREAIAALETAGMPRSAQLVAWDFTVRDDAEAMRDPLAARELAGIAFNLNTIPYTVTSDLGTINNDPRIARRIELDFMVPEIATAAGFHRDGMGNVMVNGTDTAHAYIMVPPCATSRRPPAAAS